MSSPSWPGSGERRQPLGWSRGAELRSGRRPPPSSGSVSRGRGLGAGLRSLLAAVVPVFPHTPSVRHEGAGGAAEPSRGPDCISRQAARCPPGDAARMGLCRGHPPGGRIGGRGWEGQARGEPSAGLSIFCLTRQRDT